MTWILAVKLIAPTSSGSKFWIASFEGDVTWTFTGSDKQFRNGSGRVNHLNKPSALHSLTNKKTKEGYEFECFIWVNTTSFTTRDYQNPPDDHEMKVKSTEIEDTSSFKFKGKSGFSF